MTGILRTLLDDRRARVPFAVIGISLLLLSGTFVVQTDTRDDSPPTLEVDQAMERTETAVQTALTNAVADASEQAAMRPLTTVIDTPYGQALSQTHRSSETDIFDRYLKALIYLNANDRFGSTGQQIGDVETEIRIPAITDPTTFEDAISRVTVRPGKDHSDLESGIVEVTIANVTLIARRGGSELTRQTKTLTVSVATPLYQLHDRTALYQDRLDAGILDSGFTQRFNARIYALGWARGYAQYGGAPVTEVVANRHVVPSANDAIYRTQKDVFGSTDPQLNGAIRRGWLCMAFHDAEGLYGGFADDTGSVADTLCETSDWLFGDQATGELPDAPGTMELLGTAPGMDAEHTIGVNETALLPLREMVSGSGEHTFDRVIDRIFEVETSLEYSLETRREPTFTHDPPRPYAQGESSVEHVENERTTVVVSEISEPDDDSRYYDIKGVARFRLRQTKEHTYRDIEGRQQTTTTAMGTRAVGFEISLEEEQISPTANIDSYNRAGSDPLPVTEEYVYQPGPKSELIPDKQTVPEGTDVAGFPNYGDVGHRVLATFFTERDLSEREIAPPVRADEIEAWLEQTWTDATVKEDLALPSSETISIPTKAENTLRRTLVSDITAIQDHARDITHRFERSDILHGGTDRGPYGELIETVDRKKQEFLNRTDPYANIGQKAIYEARYSYFEILASDLARLESAHGHAMDELDTELSDLDFGRALSYLQNGVTATPPDPVSIESPSVTGDVSYEIEGSPTYLVTENITAEEVPPVGSDIDAFAPMAARNENYLKLPYESVVDGLIRRIADLFDLGSPDAELTFQMASDALRAGELATAAATADDEFGDATGLESLTEEFEQSVASALSEFRHEAAVQVAFHLYPNDVVGACADRDCTPQEKARLEVKHGDVVTCDRHGCEYDFQIPEECTALLCAFSNETVTGVRLPQITRAVGEAISEYSDSTAEVAAAIDSGEINDRIVDAVFDRLNASNRRPTYARHLHDDAWREIIQSATRSATMVAANHQTVSLSETELVETLDREIRRTLENVSDEIVRERFEERLGEGTFDIDEYDDWVDGIDTPLRVPAGMPLLPLPNLWFATVNVWDIEVAGEYARFEVTTNAGTPDGAGPMSYVRENATVDVEIAGENRELGTVEPITVSGRSVLVVVVPPGGLGVGDRDDDDPECSPTWPVTGDVAQGTVQCTETTVVGTDKRENAPARPTDDAVGREVPWR